MKLKFVSEFIEIASLRFFKALGGIEDYSDSSSELFKKRTSDKKFITGSFVEGTKGLSHCTTGRLPRLEAIA